MEADYRRFYPPLPHYPTKAEFEAGKRSFAGLSNPEHIKDSFWTWMVRTGSGPYYLRKLYRVDLDKHPPIWTFARMGASHTFIQGNRVLSIGGEHEDYYDPDFKIYNDVVIRDFNGNVWIYGYPYQSFPPTDFHTATLSPDRSGIYIIGGLGYPKDREFWRTPVYFLNLYDMSIAPIQTTGEEPGWIWKHTVAALEENILTLTGGELWTSEEKIVPNQARYHFDLLSHHWTRL